MSDEPTDPPRVPAARPSPKRGAIPTPASEIEQATPYSPAETDPETPASPEQEPEQEPEPDHRGSLSERAD